MERKKRSKGRGWESCYVKKNYGTFGVEMRAYGQKLVKFCTHTHAAKVVVEIIAILVIAILNCIFILQLKHSKFGRIAIHSIAIHKIAIH